MSKSPDAFRTISEVADDLDLPQHVLRFWETRFTQIRPMKRGGGRRYYRPDDVDLLRGIRHLLYGEGYTIRGVQRILKEQGPRFVVGAGRGEPLQLPARDAADEVDDREPDDEIAPPIMAAPRPRMMPAPDVRPPAPARLSPDDAGRLQATLAELLECKRLLDQAR